MSISTIIASLPLAYLAIIAIPLIVIDYKQHRLPNKLVLPMVALGLITDFVASAVSGEWWRLGIAFGIAFAILVLGLVANYFEYLGMGDVKLFVATTLVVAWFVWWLALVLVAGAIAFGFISTIVLYLTSFTYRYRHAGRQATIPLGVFIVPITLVLGSLAVVA